MAGCPWILSRDAAGWHALQAGVAEATVHALVDESATPTDLAAALSKLLQEHDYRGEPVLWAVAAADCLAVTMPLERAAQARQRQAILYQIEAWLPTAAEDLVCDFILHTQAALGVAMPLAIVRPLVEAIENQGILLQTIAPAVLLAVTQHVARSGRMDRHYVLWGEPSGVDLIVLADGKPLTWQRIESDAALLVQRLQAEALTQAGTLELVAYDLPEPLLSAVQGLEDVHVLETLPTKLTDAALTAAGACLAGTASPPVELRRDALASRDPYRPVRGLLRLAAASVVALTLLLSGSMLWKSYRYEALAADMLARQEAAYREVFPGQSIPAGMLSRLQSERTKLAGLQGNGAATPTRPSALLLLYRLLASIPNGLRCRIIELRLEQGRMQLEGELRCHGDADALASGLRTNEFRVDLPKTQQLSGSGVALRMIAETASLPTKNLQR